VRTFSGHGILSTRVVDSSGHLLFCRRARCVTFHILSSSALFSVKYSVLALQALRNHFSTRGQGQKLSFIL